jgi:hypothetical protein
MLISEKERIQAQFFRTGSYSYLHIEQQPDQSIKWTFTFLDMGMCHCFTSQARVSMCPPSQFIMVDDKEYPSLDQALHAIFGGHYQRFLQSFYRDLGVTPTPKRKSCL